MKNWREIDGPFLEGDYEAYKRMTDAVPDGGTIIEIGCWGGRSICSQHENIKAKKLRVICGDMFQRSWWDTKIKFPADELGYLFMKNVVSMGFVPIDIRRHISEPGTTIEMYEGPSIACASYLKRLGIKADLIFIDAGHRYNEIRGDIFEFWDIVKDGGIMGGHDYTMNAEMKSGVDSCFTEDQLNRKVVDHTCQNGCCWEVRK